MRPQYFKHRALFDFDKQTNDVGFPLPWTKGNEDNHFLFRLYKKNNEQYETFYQYQLNFFLGRYEDATEQEFFVHVKQIITDSISELINKDRYTPKHVRERQNRLQLQEFLDYLNTIDQWFIQSTDQETIKRQLEEIAKLNAENKKLKEENKKLRELETKDYIDIREGRHRTLYHLILQIRELKLDDNKELANATTLNIWSKMIAKYFRAGGKEISIESVKRYFPPDNNTDNTKYKDVPKKDQLFTIVPAKKRSL
ncbi:MULTISPECIES: hypothetical protein [unclassified Mucilaginibacter]|uniref:hypothetical protein n=1 Tax=unclassified Mucilaginibacter TaxID=2617802 RepID=UPI00095F66E2|nr:MULTISPECIES: hypothetical protein [unclassified Mucilaginibacter]OJW18178.1 MAG: hypothetical protein BGO48_16585 [Mucilaginibacter sp. 44-25]PLW91498.1 MAG: hypothetical protein C0154_00985 [Mucilaginibacter sp.]